MDWLWSDWFYYDLENTVPGMWTKLLGIFRRFCLRSIYIPHIIVASILTRFRSFQSQFLDPPSTSQTKRWRRCRAYGESLDNTTAITPLHAVRSDVTDTTSSWPARGTEISIQYHWLAACSGTGIKDGGRDFGTA